MHTRHVAERLKEFEDICRRQGLPLTVQRRVILEELLRRDDHPTADQVYEAVQPRIPGVSRTTVYRVLDWLVDVGVIQRAQHMGVAVRYDGKTHRHHHLVCTGCGRVTDFEDSRLDQVALPGDPEGFRIRDYTIQFTGICAECRRKLAEGEDGLD